jgi:hypothetical protein
MSEKFVLTLDLTDHGHPENPMVQRVFVLQMLQQAAQAIGSGYVDPRVKTGAGGVQSDHPSGRHAQGDIVAGAAFAQKKIGSWAFLDGRQL